MKRTIIKPGNVYSVPLDCGKYGYAQALEFPEFAFFNVATENELSAQDVVTYPVMFRIWVHKSSVSEWNKIGKVQINSALSEQVPRFKQDAINGKLSIYINAQEKPASFNEVKGLECAAIWESSHILSRICDHLAGKENKWVKLLQPKQNG
jgi:hypothetical protein